MSHDTPEDRTSGGDRIDRRPAPQRSVEKPSVSGDRNRRERLEAKYPGLSFHSAGVENAGIAERKTLLEEPTPREAHYIRNHYPSPEIDGIEWTISLSGEVERKTALGVHELIDGYPKTTVRHVMECAGNGREQFDGRIPGVPWRFGALGCAEWSGASLATILDRHGADSDADWLLVAGGDGSENDPVYARSLPMWKAKESVLAYRMNDEALRTEHGFPVRLIVPGWYGNNCVKWVSELRVMDVPIAGEEWDGYDRWQNRGYRIVPENETPITSGEIKHFDVLSAIEAGVEHPYIYDQLVKSIIATPDDNAVFDS